MRNNENDKPGGEQKSLEAEVYSNPVIKVLLERASCRNFQDKKIPSEVIEAILKAGIHTPSGGNLQPFSIIQIEDQKTRKELGKMCAQKFIGTAPLNLLFCMDWNRLKRWANLEVAPFTATSSFRHFWISFQDTIIAAQNICTAADSLGLGSCYIGTIIEHIDRVREMFDLPEAVFPVVLLCVGYPVKKPSPSRKLELDAIVHREKYRKIDDDQLIEFFKHKYPGMEIPPSGENLRTIFEVSREAHNEKFARKCIEKIKQQGFINAAQYYFGLHYSANIMPKSNEEFLKKAEEMGFYWFKEYTPSD